LLGLKFSGEKGWVNLGKELLHPRKRILPPKFEELGGR
jgi:hypothetical protein